jgi:thiopurine S-methyltransferase
MNPEFWLDRWSRSQVGFHQTIVEPYLEQHRAVLGSAGRLFVPLCGKSLDLRWLRDQGHEVLGVELAEAALEAFCAENGVPARRRTLPDFDRYEAPRLTLLCGDFFKLSAHLLGRVTAVYDRAALVSWAPDMRASYVQHLTAITPAASAILLVAIEYPQEEMSGPPFSVTSGEIERLFSGSFEVTELDRRDVLSREPRMRDRGVSLMSDVCYQLVRRG